MSSMAPGSVASSQKAGSEKERQPSSNADGLNRYLTHASKCKHGDLEFFQPAPIADASENCKRTVDRAKFLEVLHHSNYRLKSAWEWVSGRSLTKSLSSFLSLTAL